MRNEERKIRFAREALAENSFKYAKHIFTTASAYEEKFGKDVSEFSEEELRVLMDAKFGLRDNSMRSIRVVLDAYAAWCRAQGYPVAWERIPEESDFVAKYRTMMISSPRHLSIVLDQVFDPVREETVDCLYRSYFWFAFAGMKHDDAIALRKRDVDLEAHEILGRYPVYREGEQALRVARDASRLRYKHANYTTDIFRERADNDLIFRGMRTERITPIAIRQAIMTRTTSEAGNNLFPGLKYSNVRLSGIFYRVYEAEKHGVPANFDEVVLEKIQHIPASYQKNLSRAGYANRIRKEYGKDYAHWKEAFYPDKSESW